MRPSRQPHHRFGVRLGLAIALALPAAVLPAALAQAADVVISGVVYRDLNNSGTQDAGEPGVPNLKVYSGRDTRVFATTDAVGNYALALPATWPTSNIFVGTGWFRSRCDVLSCDAQSTGVWAVDNQRVRMKVDPTQGSLPGRHVGLVPDWPGGVGPIPTQLTANAVDVAVRLSGATTTGCDTTMPALNICGVSPPASPDYSVQVLNQGTQDLTGVQAGLAVPHGDCLVSARLDTGASPTGVSLTTTPATFTCSTRTVTLAYGGTIPAGAQVIVILDSTVNAGPGTTGCVLPQPASTCSAVEPQGRSWQVGISAMNQTPDVDSPVLCAGSAAFCGTGIHDKRYEPDHVDVAGHNVAFLAGDSTAVNLKVDLYLARPAPSGGFHPGDTVVFRAHVVNNAGAGTTNQAFAGWVVRTYFPVGTTLPAAMSNSIVGCTPFPAATPNPYVECKGKGPIAAYVASVAVDLPVTVASSWPVGTPFAAGSCAIPLAGQVETVPADSVCNYQSTQQTTTTDNDDAKSVSVT